MFTVRLTPNMNNIGWSGRNSQAIGKLCVILVRPIRRYRLITYDHGFIVFCLNCHIIQGRLILFKIEKNVIAHVKISLKTADAFKHSSSIVIVVVLPRREWRECMVGMIVGYFWNPSFSYFLLIFLLIPNITRAQRTMSSYYFYYYFYDAIGFGNV